MANIVCHYDEYLRFVLVDFDNAIFSPSDEPLNEFFEVDHAPEILEKDHDFKVDIWVSGF